MEGTDNYFSEVINALIHLDRKTVESIVEAIDICEMHNHKVLTCGNGGSATTASHFAGDLSKTCGVEAYSLVDSNYLITALANDCGYENIFAHQIDISGYTGDLLIVFSGSGLSPNIIESIDKAKELNINTIGITGRDGGRLKELCDICLIVPSEHMEVIEDVHLSICHCIVEILKGLE